MTRKTAAGTRPAARKISTRRAKAKAATPAASTLRRDLGQQTSRFALLTAIGLAAAGAASLMTPGEALAQCATTDPIGNTVNCGTTTTTDAAGPPNGRLYTNLTAEQMSLTVGQGAVVDGNGLALINTGPGGASVVNNGVIRVNEDALPTFGGSAALSLRSVGGPVTYSGAGDVVNEGIGDGIDAEARGDGSIDLNVGGDVSAARGSGIIARNSSNDGEGGVRIVTAGDVTANGFSGIEASSNRGDVNVITNGDVTNSDFGILATHGAGPGNVNIQTNGDVHGGVAGIAASMNGDGAVDIAVNGAVTAELGAAINVQSVGDSVAISAGDVSGGRGIEVFGIGGGYTGDLTVQAGSVSGSIGAAIDAASGAGARLELTGDVTGATDGIRLLAGAGDSGGEGDANVTVAGNVTGTSGDGVNVLNESEGAVNVDIDGAVTAGALGVSASAAGPITLSVGSVTGGTGGIRTHGRASQGGVSLAAVSDVNVTVAGDIVAQNGRGYENIQDGTGATNYTQAGGITSNNGDGIHIRHGENSGDINVDVGGPITSTGTDIDPTPGGSPADGIDAVSDSANGGITIVARGDVSGAGNAITARLTNAGATDNILIRAEGDVNGGTGSGILATSAGAEGDIAIVATGDVTGGDNAAAIAAELSAPNAEGNIGIGTTGAVTGGVGIAASHAGTGNITVVANGDVTGEVGSAIRATSGGGVAIDLSGHAEGATTGIVVSGGSQGSGDVLVTGTNGSVTSHAGNAIDVTNRGSGATQIFTDGAVNATGGSGVDVEDSASSGGMSVRVRDDVTGTGGYGVNVNSRSEQGTVIGVRVEGDVQGTLGGINISTAAGSGDVNVMTGGTVDGGVGIAVARNGANSATTIVAEGAVTGRTGAGIQVTGNNGALSITAADVTGATDGISVTSTGDGGPVTITGSGNLTAQNGSGFNYTNPGSGTVDFTWDGAIDATDGDGVRVRDTAAGGDITIDVGAVTARGTDAGDNFAADGIDIISVAEEADINITTRGDVRADNLGIRASFDNAGAEGDIVITALGAVTGGGTGIVASNSGSGDVSIATDGAVTGVDGDGIYAFGQGAVSVTANGSVTGADSGISVEGGANGTGEISVTGSGEITSEGGDAVTVRNNGTGPVNVDLSGAIEAAEAGIVVDGSAASTEISVIAGDITAGGTGIHVTTTSEEASIDIVAKGDIAAGDDSVGIFASLGTNGVSPEGDLTIAAQGAVTGGSGISARNFGTGGVYIRTDGPVTGTSGEAIAVTSSRNVTVEANATVTGATRGATIFGGQAGLGDDVEQDIVVRGTGGFVGEAGDALNITNRGRGDVRVNISGASASTGGHGIVVTDTADGGDIDISTGAITATGANINIGVLVQSNSTEGNVAVTTNGDVTAADLGILATLGAASAGDISVTANGAVRGQVGIEASTTGTGNVRVETNGAVTATRFEGVYAEGRRAVTLEVNDTVTGQTYGARIEGGEAGLGDDVEQDITIRGAGGFVSEAGQALRVTNRGHGDVSIDLTGDITAAADGILIIDNDAGGDIDINVGAVSAGDKGIVIDAATETGSLSVTTNGAVEVGGTGIFARLAETDSIGSIEVTANGAVSGERGIFAGSEGLGDVSVTAEGDVTASDEYGIRAFGRGAVTLVANGTVRGVTEGATVMGGRPGSEANISVTGTGGFVADNGNALQVMSNGEGEVLVDIAGDITATGGSGVLIVDTEDGGDIDVTVGSVRATAAATTTTPVYGVDQRSSSLTGDNRLRTTGDVYGTTGGIVMGLLGDTATGEVSLITDGDVAGGFGIQAFNAGTGALSVTTNGAVTGETGSGLQAIGRGAVSVAVNGQVTGASQGLIVQGGEAANGDNIVVTGTGAVTSGEGDAVFVSNRGNGTVNYDLSGALSATDGDGLFIRDTEIGGDITVRTGNVTALDGIGLNIVSLSDTADLNLTVDGDVAAGEFGVLAMLAHNQGTGVPNLATGAIRVVTNGDVTAESGILAIGGGQGGAVDVEVNGDVTGTDGAGVSIGGTGDASLRVEGSVTGSATGAIVATTGDITVSGAGDFAGGTGAGLALDGQGDGDINVDLTGEITSQGGDAALVASMGGSAGGDITLNVGDVTANGAASRGIDVYSASNAGDISVSAGTVNAGGVGIRALREIDATGATGNISIDVDGPIQADTGIFARNIGAGSTSVVAAGSISATDGSGIIASAQGGAVSVEAGTVNAAGTDSAGVFAQRTGAGAGDVTVDVGSARGARGVVANNSGAGDVTVTADTATGTAEEAIVAQKLGAGTAGDVEVTVASATGHRGVLASNQGAGTTRVTSTGTITAAGTEGVLAFAAGAGGVSVDVNNVTGGTIGVATSNNGTGATDIAINGLVTGSQAGVLAASSGDQAVRINNDGTIRNTSNRSDSIALQAGGGQIDLTNAGDIVGRLILQGDASNTVNRGSWNAIGGLSDFQGSDDRLTNTASGRIIGGADAAAGETSLWQGLETFTNSGTIDLSDGGIGDLIATSADAVFADGGVLQVDIGGVNLADVFRTTGTLTLDAGTRLELGSIQSLSVGRRYIVASAAQGLTGEFDFEERLVSAFVGLRDGYTATDAYLELWQMRAFEEAGDTWNRRETGRGVDSLPETNPLHEAVLTLPDDGAARAAFDQLSGEIHPAMRRAMVDESRLSREAVLERLEGDGEGSVWAHGLYGRGRVSADGNASRAERDTGGAIFGADGSIAPGVTIGAAGGWIDSDIDLERRNSNGTARNVHAMGYAGFQMERWSLRGGVGYSWTSVDTERSVAFPGVTDRLRAEYDGSVMQAFLEAGYRVPTNGGYVEPFVNLTTIHANTDAFREIGGVARIEGEGVRDDLNMATAGFRVQTARPGAFSARGMFGVRHMDGDLAQAGQHRFPGGAVFTILTSRHDDIAAVATFEADWQLTPWLSLGAVFDGAKGEDGGDHAITGRLKMAF